MKRLFYDIETSPNVGLFWRPGYRISVSPESIIRERKVITIAWKWAGEKKVHALHWDDKQDDRAMLREFIAVLNKADESVAHFGDSFDLPWVKGRCLHHGIATYPKYITIDTKAWASKYFYFNSNKLDYLAKFLGHPQGKIKTDYEMWKKITLNLPGKEKALRDMVRYNQQDVDVLEWVFNKMEPAVPHRTHVGVLEGGEKWHCAKCASQKVKLSKTRVTSAGTKKLQMQCLDCGGYYSISEASFKKYEDS